MQGSVHKKVVHLGCLGILMSPAILSANLLAGEMEKELGISLKLSFDDNVFLDTLSMDEVYRADINPTLNLTYEEDRYQAELSATGTFRKSSDQDVEKDRFDFGVDLAGSYEFPTSALNGGLGFSRQSVLDTEFDDSGQLRANDTRNTGKAQIGFQAELSELWRMNISDDFQIVEYGSAFFSDYWNNSVTVGFETDRSEYAVLTMDFSYARYHPDSELQDSINSYRFSLGLRYSYAENTSFEASVGGTYVHDKLRWSATVQLSHELENLHITLDASRQVSPSGLGEVRQTEKIGTSISYTYSEDVSAGVGASWRRSNSISSLIQRDTESQEVSPWLSWSITEHGQMRLSYRLRRQKLTVPDGWGLSNSVFLEFRY